MSNLHLFGLVWCLTIWLYLNKQKVGRSNPAFGIHKQYELTTISLTISHKLPMSSPFASSQPIVLCQATHWTWSRKIALWAILRTETSRKYTKLYSGYDWRMFVPFISFPIFLIGFPILHSPAMLTNLCNTLNLPRWITESCLVSQSFRVSEDSVLIFSQFSQDFPKIFPGCFWRVGTGNASAAERRNMARHLAVDRLPLMAKCGKLFLDLLPWICDVYAFVTSKYWDLREMLRFLPIAWFCSIKIYGFFMDC